MRTVKHIYWFAYFDTSEPSVRYRAKYPLEILRKEYSITYDLVLPSYQMSNIVRFLRIYLSVLLFRKPDSVIVFEKIRTRRIYATLLKLLLKIHPIQTIYDIDDADYLKFPPETIHFFMKHCEKCTVGSAKLAEYVSFYNKQVSIVTSPVIDHIHVKTSRNDLFTVGWIGYYNAHRKSLIHLLFPALLQSDKPIKLVLMGVTKPEHVNEIKSIFSAHTNITVVVPYNADWEDEENIYTQLALFDVGVAPLLDTAINQSKSAFKLKQYLSCGVPVLGSEVGENNKFLKHNVNGFICRTPEEYSKYIKHISEMGDLEYRQLSLNALNTRVEFNMAHYCSKLMKQMCTL